MPDFEALIKHQQIKRPETNQRLKIVDKQTNNNLINKKDSSNPLQLILYFFIGFTGGLVGAATILFLNINNVLPLEIFKLN